MRPLLHADLERLTEIWTDPEVARLLLTRPRDRAEVEERLLAMIEHARLWGLWALELRATGALIGRCGFYPYRGEGARPPLPEPELAYFVAREQWGLGLASEAARAALDALFGSHSCERSLALVHPENAASRRVLEKVGMRAIGPVSVAGATAMLHATQRSPR
ncbi:MAG: GNAT family N-acetyltransferase [Myxococcota bacterium]